MKGTKFNDYLAKKFEDNDFEVEFDKADQELDAAVALYHMREQLGLTQRELAKLSGKQQATIARIENGNLNPSIKTLRQIGQSVGKKIKIEYV